MNSFANKKTQNGLINRYQTNLERRIEKGDQSLVCRDEGLCKEVEVLLCNNNAQKIHTLHGLDPLTVMEKSLHEFPSKTGQMGLEKLAKAFEVLELASLNLYVFPWRREYRLVKTFSSMFTHLIKPALTLQQAKELFALLGYQPSISNEDEELALNSKPAPSDFILALACGFFTARMECQLLLSSLGSAHRGVEWVLLLVKERQAGHSLQVALDNAKKKSEVASAADAILTSGVDTELDLYTGETDVTSAPFSPPHSSYTQPKEIKPDSDMRNNDVAGQRRSINSPGPMESFGEDQSKGIVVSCIASDVALKMSWCASVECLSSPLPLYNIYGSVLIMCG
ncbi:spermatogenesis-associated protein [Pimephales promelas]|nr:spermatogenesis-associated protein [Pimephales promelas]